MRGIETAPRFGRRKHLGDDAGKFQSAAVSLVRVWVLKGLDHLKECPEEDWGRGNSWI